MAASRSKPTTSRHKRCRTGSPLGTAYGSTSVRERLRFFPWWRGRPTRGCCSSALTPCRQKARAISTRMTPAAKCLPPGREAVRLRSCFQRTDSMQLDFYFAIDSRYSYLAATQVPQFEAEFGCTIGWKPLSFQALMDARGDDPYDGKIEIELHGIGPLKAG